MISLSLRLASYSVPSGNPPEGTDDGYGRRDMRTVVTTASGCKAVKLNATAFTPKERTLVRRGRGKVHKEP